MATPNDLEPLLASAVRDAGFDLYLVGGALRDELRGESHDDLDFSTNARPEDTVHVLESIPGLTIYRVGEKFGTIGAVVEGKRAEITTYRSAEKYAAGSRKPTVQYGETVEEDLSRRDFTINAMARPARYGDLQSTEATTVPASAYKPPSPSGPIAGARSHSRPDDSWLLSEIGSDPLIDPFHGLEDLRRHLIRAVGDPNARFVEDPLRLLRGVRFAAGLGFEIESETWEAMGRSAPLLEKISRERIADEFNRMLTGPNPTRAVTLLRDSGALRHSIPELLDLDRIPDQGPYHRYSLWDHTFRVVEGVQPDLVLRWAALLHDIGKPQTMTTDASGRIRFFEHDDIGAAIAEHILRSLKVSNEVIASVRRLVATHMQVHQYSDRWSDGAVRRLDWKLAHDFDRAVELARSDARGHGTNPWSHSGADALADRADRLRRQLPRPSSPLSGEQLMERFQRPPGPWIKTIKDGLTDLVTDGRLRPEDVEEAWAAAERIEQTTRG